MERRCVKLLLAVSLVAGAVTVAALVMWRQQDGRPPFRGERLPPPSAATEGPDLEVGAAERRTERIDATRTEIVGSGSASPLVAPLNVRVVAARDGRSVPGAIVRTLAVADPDAVNAAGLYDVVHVDLEQLAATLGMAATTDAAGIAPLPRPMGRESYRQRVYVARAGERYGEAVLADQDAAELVIEIDVDRALRVLVVDAAGSPAAGVRVQHWVRVPGGGLGTNALVVIVRTLGDGIASIPHTQLRVLADRQVSEVSIFEPGVEPVAVPFDCAAPPAAPIRLALPSTGKIVVDAVPSSVPQLLDHGGLRLREAGDTAFLKSFLQRFRGDPVTYAWVGLGRDFEVELRADAGRRGPFALRGPRRAGEVVTFTLPPWDVPILRARLVDTDGRPLPRTVVELVVSTDEGPVAKTGVAEAAGLLAVALPSACRGRVLRAVDLVVWFGPLDGARAHVEGDGRRLDGELDLGDVKPELPTLWAAGRIVDESGALLFAGPFLDLPVTVVDGAADASPPVLRKLPDGRVDLRGGADVRRIRFDGGQFLSTPRAAQLEPVEVERGARDFEVRFGRQGRLEVRLRHEPGRTCAVDLALFAESGQRIEPFPFPSALERGSVYRFDGLQPGRYRCTFTLLGEHEPLLAVDGVEIGPGANTDPRLEGVALPGVRILRVELVDDDGRLREDVRETIVYVRDGEQWIGRWFIGARVDVGVRAEAVELAVVVPGFRPVRRADVRSDVTVRLEPLATLPVRVEVVGGTVPTGYFEVRAVPLDRRSERFSIRGSQNLEQHDAAPWLGRAAFPPGAVGQVAVDGPGRYRLELRWCKLLQEPLAVAGTPEVVEVGAAGPVQCIVRVEVRQLVR